VCFGNHSPIEKTGYPRNDGMFLQPENTTFVQRVNILKKEGYKVGIYMPTYRLEGEFDIVQYFVQNIDIIDNKLKELKQVFFLKIHPFEYYKIPKEYKSNNIIFINNDEIAGDIYSVLGVFDFLISDFSSIIFDYFILERPVFLVVPDREKYIESNGRLVFDYRSIDIPVSNDWEGLLSDLEKYNNGVYEANIKSIADSFHDHKDGNSSRRLYENIVLKLGL
jgi:CDP-glycerol glycerophosphotransferase